MSPFQRFIGAVVAATVIGASIGVPIYIGNSGGGGGGGSGQASVFVALTGSSTCTRNGGTATDFAHSAGHICDNFQHAYNVASCGDTVLVESGTYGAQEIDRRATDLTCGASTCDQYQANVSTAPTGTTNNCITFQPDGCSTPVQIGVSAATSNDIWTNADYLRLDGLNCMTVYGSLAVIARSGAKLGTADSCNVAYGHDDIFQNMVFDGQFNTTVTTSPGTFQLKGPLRVSLIGDTFKNAVGSTSAGVVNRFTDCGTGGTTYGAASHSMLKNITILDQVKTVSASGHCEGIHMEDNGGPLTIINSRFLDLCEQDISLEPELAAATPQVQGLDVENNVFDYPSSHSVALGFADTFNAATFGNITIICKTAGTTPFNGLVFRNNSFGNKAGSGGTIKWQIDPGCTPSTSGNSLTGNILNGIAGCPGPTGLWNTVADNIIPSGTGCGSDIPFGSSNFPYNDAANYDYSINPANAGAVYGAVPGSTGYPSTDAANVARPNPADAGAYQH
jgi:hypothetical protein